MSVQTRLHELIHSLSVNEKALFKRRAYERSRNKKTDYLILFEALEKQDVYDEEKLKKKFRKHRIGKYFSQKKKELYDIILRFVPDAEPDTDNQLSLDFEGCKMLLEKGLFDHIPRVLDNALELAHKSESFEIHLKLLRLKKELFRLQRQVFEGEESLEGIHKVEVDTITKLENLVCYDQLKDRAYLVQVVSGENRFASIENLKAELFLINPQHCLSVSATIIFHLAHYYLNLAEGRDLEAESNLAEVISIYDQNTHLLSHLAHFGWYLTAKFSIGVFAIIWKDFKKGRKIIQEIAVLKVPGRDGRTIVQERICELKAWLISQELEPVSGRKLAGEIAEILSTLNGTIHSRVIIETYFLLCRFHLSIGEPENALSWHEKIISQNTINVRREIQVYTSFHALFAHYELNDIDAIERGVKKLLKFQRENQIKFVFEEPIIAFFTAYLDVGTPEKLKGLIAELALELDKFVGEMEIPLHKDMWEFSRFWAKSKFTGIPLLKILKDSES